MPNTYGFFCKKTIDEGLIKEEFSYIYWIDSLADELVRSSY